MPPHDHASESSSPLPIVTEIQRAVHVLGLHLEAELSDLGLSQGEMHVLSLLGQSGTMSVAELQRGVRHRPSTLTGILNRLEASGMAQRQINRSDRRSLLIELTSDGRAAAERVMDVMANVEGRLFEGRSSGEIQSFRELLNEIAQAL